MIQWCKVISSQERNIALNNKICVSNFSTYLSIIMNRLGECYLKTLCNSSRNLLVCFSSAVFFDVSKSLMCTTYTFYTRNTIKCSFFSINRAYRIKISPLFFKGSNSPDLSGRLPILPSLSWSPDFTTIVPINEIVTYYFLVFCSFVGIFQFSVFICLSTSTSPPS